MTDIEAKRQAVIDAARKWRGSAPVYYGELCKAIDELDAAERPDPWALLEEVRDVVEKQDSLLLAEIENALAWREKNND